MKNDINPKSPAQKKQLESEKKIPWWFDFHVKDLIRPITLKRMHLFYGMVSFLALAALGYYAWENYLREPTGEEFVNEIVDAAGGMDAWNQIKQGRFTREHNLYAEDGTALRTIEETFFFKKAKEGLKLQIKSVGEDHSVVWVGKDKEGYWASRDNSTVDPKVTAKEEGMMCDSKFCEPLCATSMAFYRFSMPFKLKDNGITASLASTGFTLANLSLLGSSGEEPTLLDIKYDEKIGRDSWRFYIDPQDRLIHKIEYYNKSDIGEVRPEEIYWTDHKTVDGITFSHRWTRYWPNGKVMDEYLYSDVDFTTEIADSFFERDGSSELASR